MTHSGNTSLITRIGRACINVASAGSVVGSIAGLAGGQWWFLDLFSHFRAQYSVTMGVIGLIYLLARRWIAAGVAAAIILLNGVLIAPLYWSSPVPAVSGVPFELLLFNVHQGNRSYDRVSEYVRDSGADVVVALEVTSEWSDRLKEALPDYRMVGESRDDAFGLVVLSRLPVLHSQVIRLSGVELPSIEVVIEKNGQKIALLAIHAPPPIIGQLAVERDRTIAAATEWAVYWSHGNPAQRPGQSAARQLGQSVEQSVEIIADHVVVAGDMNATPWSYPMRRISDTSLLVNSIMGFGLQASWPRQPAVLRIPIDHVLHSRTLTAVRRSVGPFLGSDHRPVRVALAPARIE
ncbi:MAG: endonuclease/exonuclease/phosphatase family protein [Proteobacteria bacterium]|nr:endonuclease/exonuclease/phosphatase family protein [Pseudomonadota bacterium]